MKKLFYIMIPIILLSSYMIKENSAIKIIKKINQYFQERPMERIFLHLDKPYYVSGDDLWYAGYILNYNSNTTSDLSEILHVELFNKEGKSIVKQKNRVINGLAQGLIELPDSLSADYYLIKGYTNWSRNFEEGLLFSHYVKIVSSTFKPAKTNSPVNQVDFYPEGGNIIAGKLNHVAFKIEQESKGYAYLVNAANDTVDKIRHNGNGFGIVRLVPQSADEQFYLVFDNNSKRFVLPKTNESGSVLRLVESNTSFRLFLESSNDMAGKEFTLIILYNGNIVSTQDGSFNNVGTLLRLPKDKFLEGLHHILVIDEHMQLLNQRLFYREPFEEKEKSIVIEANDTYEIGDYVKLKLSLGEQAVSHLSVSVTSLKYFGEASKPIISNDHFLELSDSDDFTYNDLLITEDIDTYEIEDILTGRLPDFNYLIEKDELFQITIQLGQANSEYYSISLKNKDSIDFYFNKADEAKKVSFTFPAFNGRKNVIIKRYQWSDNTANIPYTLNNSYSASPFQKKFNQSTTETAYARHAKENQLINRLYEVTNKKQIDDNHEVPPSFSILTVPDESITLKDYLFLPDMVTISRELLSGARISEKPDGTYKIQMRSIDQETGYFQPYSKNEPLRFIDGLPIYDSKYIAELDPLEIKKIEMSYGKRILNGVRFDGIFSIETVEGNYGKFNDLGQMIFDFSGYADNYAYTNAKPDPNVPDFRSTYYWNPHVRLEDKPITLSFPTSNEPGIYVVDIQGINEKGQTIVENFSFEVVGSYRQD